MSPWGITTGSDGNLWFTEYSGAAVGRITPTGTVTQFPISAGFSSGRKIIAGPDGALWFVNPQPGSGYPIERMTTAGVFSGYPSSYGTPYGITAGPDGNVWFTAQQNGGVSSVVRITPAGVETAFGDTNPGTGITGATPGAYDIATGSDGNLWFTHGPLEGSQGQIASLNPTTGVITEHAITANMVGLAIVSDPTDHELWFTNQTGNSVGLNRITTGGTFTPSTVSLSGIAPITIGPDGNVWSIDQNSGDLYDIAENFAETIYNGTSNRSSAFFEGITTGPDGNVWFTETEYGLIGRLNVAGTLAHARHRLVVPQRH